FMNQLPLFKFIRKGDGFTSLTGEKLNENQLLQAMDEVVEQEQVDVEHLTMCCDEKKLLYKLFVEFAEGTDDQRKQAFNAALDNRLKVINPEYESKRGSERLAAPILCQLPVGSYERVKDTLVARGMAREGQYKSVYLQRKPEVLAIYEEMAS
ncbi:MAG: GH3 auxin-responsive promoter family protein, partial [Deltaproteobacteria bacterium]|nr:GH3 auxin-responsive promoter family protein [Deltaproteobacteria bacterium]